MIVWVCNADERGISEITVHSSAARAIDMAYGFVTEHWKKIDGETPTDAIVKFNDIASAGGHRWVTVTEHTVDGEEVDVG
jgi:hypothetical protein